MVTGFVLDDKDSSTVNITMNEKVALLKMPS